jgi:hypothetical protein
VANPGIGQPPPLDAPGVPDEQLPETGRVTAVVKLVQDGASAIGNRRRTVGYGLGAFAILAIGGLGWWSFKALHSMKAPTTWIEEKFAFAVLAGHAVITVALIYFLYQVLRIAERLAVPYWWVDKDPSPLRTMLGVRDPISAVTKLLRELLGTLKSLPKK